MITGKGWTPAEESIFAEIMAVSRLTRIESIRLWKRCKKDAVKALKLAKDSYSPVKIGKLEAAAKANAANAARRRCVEGRLERSESVAGGLSRGNGAMVPAA